MSSVAKRYASALLDVARESGSLEPLHRDLLALDHLLKGSEDFAAFVAHPLLSPEQQQEGLDRIFGNTAFPLTQNLFKLLIARERLSFLPEIVQLGIEFLQVEQGILPVRVVSATAMSSDQEKALGEKLKARTGKQIQFSHAVDDRLIGGFRLYIGDQVEDYSLSTKLETFKRNVINA
ncbi:MAG: ATP synthase F1 subunit delta [Kiritimatiellia bacterium]